MKDKAELEVKNYLDLEFLALKSKELLEKQLESYRHKHIITGTIITVNTLFLPFFLTSIKNYNIYYSIFSIIIVLLLIKSLYCLILILKIEPLDYGFNVEKLDELVNKSYKYILLFEIGANKSSFNSNTCKLKKANKEYVIALKLTAFAVMAAIILLTFNFLAIEKKELIKVEIIKQKNMNLENEKTTKVLVNEVPANTNERSIPYVPPADRTNLNDNTPKIIIKTIPPKLQ